MTWTGAFGRACGVLLYAIVRGLALTRISPNVLTFLGLVINIAAAVLFGFASPSNYSRMFCYAGLVIIGAGILKEITAVVSDSSTNIRNMESHTGQGYGEAKVNFVIDIEDMRHLQRVTSGLRKISGVRHVQRVKKI